MENFLCKNAHFVEILAICKTDISFFPEICSCLWKLQLVASPQFSSSMTPLSSPILLSLRALTLSLITVFTDAVGNLRLLLLLLGLRPDASCQLSL